jgi:anti-sigma regulatory factor (Ser/Thr protein kinase)
MTGASQAFGVTPVAVGQVRRFVEAQLEGIEAGVVDDVILMSSELATNAIRHGRTQFDVTVLLDPDQGSIRVEVHDQGNGDVRRKVPGAYDGTGRGLQIVDQLADTWGSSPDDDGSGKTVWFVLVTTPAAPASPRRKAGPLRLVGKVVSRRANQVEQPTGSLR